MQMRRLAIPTDASLRIRHTVTVVSGPKGTPQAGSRFDENQKARCRLRRWREEGVQNETPGLSLFGFPRMQLGLLRRTDISACATLQESQEGAPHATASTYS
ncbi:hypothetical protein MRX96_018925 [Rhipicephalus microplus]